MPEFVRPMQASSMKEPFDPPDCIFETKLDGYRAIANTTSRTSFGVTHWIFSRILGGFSTVGLSIVLRCLFLFTRLSLPSP